MMNFSFILRAAVLLILITACQTRPQAAEVLPGVEVLAQFHATDLAGKKVGILTNPTGIDRSFRSTIDVVRTLPDVTVVKLFAPEHGLRGGFYAGDKVDETRDPVSGLPIESLYGKTRRPTAEMLKGLDVVIYDIQDVGVRHYTFISSLLYMMEECEKVGVEVWVLDRPEPMGGNIVAGPVLEKEYLSFIGIYTIPKVYGMTPGEFARMVQAEHTPKLKLRVIPMQGWKRGMTYDKLGWVWVSPSQHIPHWETCYYYAMTGVIGELGILNVGVGTPLPFEQIGMPGFDGTRLAELLNSAGLPGVRFRPASFNPKYGTHTGKDCTGIQIHITDYSQADPERICAQLIAGINQVTGKNNIFKASVAKGASSMFMMALGDKSFGNAIAAGSDLAPEWKSVLSDIEQFKTRRAKYLIYD